MHPLYETLTLFYSSRLRPDSGPVEQNALPQTKYENSNFQPTLNSSGNVEKSILKIERKK